MLAGKKEAYGLLFARYRLAVTNLALARLGNLTDAEAVTQDAFARAYSALDRLTETDRFGPWIFRIASNLCHDRRKEAQGRPRSLEGILEQGVAPPTSADPGPEDVAQRREIGLRISQAIADLSEPYRTTASLRYLEGRSCAEIAEILDLGIGTVTMRLSRANRLLRTALAGLMTEPPSESDR